MAGWQPASRALMAGNFAIGCGVMVVPGSLNDLSQSLAVSPAVAGQLITAGAVAMGLGAPLLAAALARFDRRALLALALLWYAAGHALAAMAPGYAALLPYLSEHWRETLARSGLADIDTVNYPPGSPLSARPDWRPAQGKPAAELAQVQAHALDAWGLGLAILNPLAGVQAVHNEDLGAALARALNTWVAREWLDRDPRLRASIVLPTQSVERCVDELEFWAQDRRFVQALVPVSGETPLGKRANWPVYAACARHGIALGVHAATPLGQAGADGWWRLGERGHRQRQVSLAGKAFDARCVAANAPGKQDRLTVIELTRVAA